MESNELEVSQIQVKSAIWIIISYLQQFNVPDIWVKNQYQILQFIENTEDVKDKSKSSISALSIKYKTEISDPVGDNDSIEATIVKSLNHCPEYIVNPIINSECNISNDSDRGYIVKEQAYIHPQKDMDIEIKEDTMNKLSPSDDISIEMITKSKLNTSSKESETLPTSPICGKDLKRKLVMDADIKSHAGELPYQCGKCDQQFANKQNLLQHCYVHKKTKEYSCQVCEKKFSQPGYVKNHMAVHTKEKHSCDECGAQFSQMSNLLTHKQNIHCAVKRWPCDNCDRNLSTKFSLANHQKVHFPQLAKPERKTSCTICGNAYGDRHMRDHMKYKHPLGGKVLTMTCHLCGKLYDNPGALRKHISRHNKSQKVYSCPICHQVFTKGLERQRHMKQHAGEKAFGCTLCNKAFSWKESLREHMKEHTGDTAHICTLCPDKFINKKKLVRHYTKHGKILRNDVLTDMISQEEVTNDDMITN